MLSIIVEETQVVNKKSKLQILLSRPMKTIVLTLTLFPWAMISIPTVQQYMGSVRYHWGSRNLKYPKHTENYGFKSFEQYAHLKRITYKTFFTVQFRSSDHSPFDPLRERRLHGCCKYHQSVKSLDGSCIRLEVQNINYSYILYLIDHIYIAHGFHL